MKRTMTTKKARSLLSLAFAVMLLSTTLFVGHVYTEVYDLDKDLETIKKQTLESREDFLRKSLNAQGTFIETMENYWYDILENQQGTSMNTKFTLFESDLRNLINQTYYNLVVVFMKDGQPLFRGFVEPEYEKYYNMVEDWTPLKQGEVRITNGDPDMKFGEGNRIFMSGTPLLAPNNQNGEIEVLQAFVLFEEQIALETMVKTVNYETVDAVQEKNGNLVLSVGVFVVVVMMMGTTILYVLVKLQTDIEKATCPYYGESRYKPKMVWESISEDKNK